MSFNNFIEFQESIDGRRKRRPRVDPAKLDMSQITGEENVSVINRETGKKVSTKSDFL